MFTSDTWAWCVSGHYTVDKHSRWNKDESRIPTFSGILTYLSYLKKGLNQLIYEIRAVYGVPAPEHGSTIWFRLNDVVLGELKVGPYEFNLKKSKENE